jgi:hypothetical protein
VFGASRHQLGGDDMGFGIFAVKGLANDQQALDSDRRLASSDRTSAEPVGESPEKFQAFLTIMQKNHSIFRTKPGTFILTFRLLPDR